MKKGLIIILIVALSAVTGAVVLFLNTRVDFSMPDGAPEFRTVDFTNPDDSDDGYAAIRYKGRLYIPYGTLGEELRKKDVTECIGYRDGDEADRLYLVGGDAEHNFIMEYYTTGVMEQPSFYRAADTNGENIEIPDFIESMDYDYWRK